MKKDKSDDFDKDIIERCKDSEFAAEYLNEILRDKSEGLQVRLLIGLRHVAQAYGFKRLAEQIGRSRETLYVILSEKGNPSLDTLLSILNTFGIEPTFNLKRSKRASKRVKKAA